MPTRERSSPFQGRQRNGRPKLKFADPRETEEFVLSQPKTDYTYSTSPSYSSDPSTVDDTMDNYDIPYMSRRSYKNPGYPPSFTTKQSRANSSFTPSDRQYSLDPSGSRRRSSRLAGRPLEDAPPMPHNTSTQYPSHSSLKPIRGGHDSIDHHHGNGRGRPRVPPSNSSRSGLFSEKEFGPNDQSLTHLYGLDEFDETELSDTESSQANQKYSSSSSDSSEWSERRSSIDVLTVMKMIIITTIYITTFIPRTAYNYLRSRSAISTPKTSSVATGGVSSFIYSVSHTLYTLVASTLLMDVWILTRTRSWLSGVGVATPVTAGLKEGSLTSSYTSERDAHRRGRRRGGFPCWLFLLLLLLPILSSLYLFWGFVPFLMPLAANKTNETQHIATAADDVTVLLTGLGTDAPPPAAGCLQCLRKEDLSLIVLGLIKETTDTLQGQILEQDKQILLMLRQGAEQESRISSLRAQIQEHQRMAPSSTPDPPDSSLEEELLQMRGDLRNLIHAAPRDDGSIPEHVSSSIQAFQVDLDRMSSKLSDLGRSFEESKTTQATLEASLQNTRVEMSEGMTEAMEPVYSLRDEFSLQLRDLEGRLSDLKNLLAVLEGSSDNQQEQIMSIVDQINDLEADAVKVKATLTALDLTLNSMKSEFGDKAGVNAFQELRNDLEEHKTEVRDVRLIVSQHERNVGSIELEVKSLRDGIDQLEAGRLALEESYINDKETFGVLLQKTSESNSERITKLSSDIEGRLQGLLVGSAASDAEELALIKQSMIQQRENLQEDIDRNADVLKALEERFSDLNNALNGTDPGNEGNLMIVHKLQATEGDLRDLRLQVEGMQSLQASVDGSSSVSEAVLAQVAEVRTTLASMEGQVSGARRSVEDLSMEVDDIEKSLGLLQGRTASQSGSPINFVTMENNVAILQQTINDLTSAVDEIKLDNRNQDGRIEAAITEGATVREHMTSNNGDFVNLFLMQSNFDTFQARIDDVDDSVASLTKNVDDQGDSLGLVLADRENQYNGDQMGAIRADIASLRETLENLEGMSVGSSSDSAGMASQLVDLGSKVAALEAGLAALKTGREGNDMAGLLAGLQADVDYLRQRLDKLPDLEIAESGSEGLGMSGTLHSDEDISNLKSDLSKLNAQYNSMNLHMSNCCYNKTDMTGFSLGPGFNFFSSNADANISEDAEKIKGIVYGILNQYSADKTGMVDYALESAGGSVVSTRCSETYTSKTALLSIFGVPLWYVTNSARTALQPDVHPGNCWAFKGAIGFLVIQLSDTIQPTYFTMEHIPKSLSPSGEIPSAPRNFSVWSLKDEHDLDGVLLGEYVYDDDGPPVQVFPVEKVDVTPTMMVELKIHSNYGSLEYTCLYRFRVHGDLYRP